MCDEILGRCIAEVCIYVCCYITCVCCTEACKEYCGKDGTNNGSRNTNPTNRTCSEDNQNVPIANQTADIWNISGRVNHQDGPVTAEPQRWPTHDHHVSLDSFVIPEGHQHNKKDRIPPPPYSEVDLPTYEQATALPRPKDELASVHVIPSSSRNGEANNAS